MPPTGIPVEVKREMPKKPVEKIRVPLNVLVAPDTKAEIGAIQNVTRESQGEIVDRAVALLAHGEVVEPRSGKKESKKARAIRERAQSDFTAQIVGRSGEIDYPDVESAPTTHVASLDAVGAVVDGGQGKVALENWRANRKPLMKPKDQK